MQEDKKEDFFNELAELLEKYGWGDPEPEPEPVAMKMTFEVLIDLETAKLISDGKVDKETEEFYQNRIKDVDEKIGAAIMTLVQANAALGVDYQDDWSSEATIVVQEGHGPYLIEVLVNTDGWQNGPYRLVRDNISGLIWPEGD